MTESLAEPPAARSARSRVVDVLVATVVAVPWVWGWMMILLDAVALLGAPAWAVVLSSVLSIGGGAVGVIGGLLVVAALRGVTGTPPAEVTADG